MGRTIFWGWVILAALCGFALWNVYGELVGPVACLAVALSPWAWAAMVLVARWLLGIDQLFETLGNKGKKKTTDFDPKKDFGGLGIMLFMALGLGVVVQGCTNANGAPMAPQTNFTYLQKIQDGVIFSEGFENDNFVSADGWTVLQGIPANTSAQYIDGIKSWDNSANAQSVPVAKKIISFVPPTREIQMTKVFFYDDVAHTTENGPYLKVKFSGGNVISLGVRNGISTSNYAYAHGSGKDAPDSDTGIGRTTGWHSFIIQQATSTPGSLNIYIDGNNFLTGVSVEGYVTEISVCADTIGGGGPSFGYFDDLGLYKNLGCNISLSPSSSAEYTASLYDQFNNYVTYGLLTNSQEANLFFGFSSNLPFSGYIEIRNYPSNSLAFRSGLMSLNPGDVYEFQPIHFGRRALPYQPKPSPLSNINQSTSGVTETLFNAFQDKNIFGLQALEGLDMKADLDNWYAYASQGDPFSVALDDSRTQFGVLAATPDVNTNLVTLMPNLSTNPTDGFVSGRQYVLFNAANTKRRTLTLGDMDTNTLGFTDVVGEAFQELDYVRDITFYPFQELANNPYGFQMKDERAVRFDFIQSMQDYNGG